MGTTSVTADVLVLLVAVGLLAVAVLATHLGAAVRSLLVPAPPALPDDDRPPAGLGRLVPVGTQVDQEVRRGVVALELWLVAHRRG